jgi:hypothetical protein
MVIQSWIKDFEGLKRKKVCLGRPFFVVFISSQEASAT